MSEKYYVGLNVTNFEDVKKTLPVSRITLNVDSDHSITAGDDSGLEIVSDCAHATREMANAILARMKGYQYQAYTADAANIDPAAEPGDGVTVGGVYGMLSNFSDDGSGFPGISAPGEMELEDEFPTQGGPLTRTISRKIADTNSRITKTAEDITLRVEKVETTAKENLDNYAASVTKSLSNLQTQIDGQIETWYYDYEPKLTNAPASGWSSDLDKAKHEGDLFYWKSKGYAYRFFKDGTTWKWQMVQDTDISLAIGNAKNAQDTADNKRRVFVAQPKPPYDVGDLWSQGPNGELYRCNQSRASGAYNASDWGKASKYTDDTTAINKASEINQRIDSIKLSVVNGASSSTLTLTADGIEAQSANITFSGLVNFVNKSDIYSSGKTTIDGGKITAGSISADKLSVTDLQALGATIAGFTITNASSNKSIRAGDLTSFNDANPQHNGIVVSTEGIRLGNSNGVFVANKDGSVTATNVTISGNVTAKTGSIGGYTIAENALYTGASVSTSGAGNVALSSSTFTRSVNGVSREFLKFAIGNNFAVNNNGILYASGAHISGDGDFTGTVTTSNITATGGTIGGWNIGTGLTYDDGSYMGGFRPNNATNVLYIGYVDENKDKQYPFVLKRDGSLKATKADISSGKIAEFSIVNTSANHAIYSGMTTLNSAANGIYLGTTGIALGGGKFKVTDAGALTAKSGTIGGFTITDNELYSGTAPETGGIRMNSTTNFNRVINNTSRALRFAIGSRFGVTAGGKIYASEVDISGNIEATSGSFTGTITAKSGSFGSLTVTGKKTTGSFGGLSVDPRTPSATGGTFSGGLNGVTGSLSDVIGSFKGSLSGASDYNGSIYSGGTFTGTLGTTSTSGGFTSATGNFSGGLNSCSTNGTSLGVANGSVKQYDTGWCALVGDRLAGMVGGSTALSVSGGEIGARGSKGVFGSLSVTGDKERILETKDFGTIGLHSFETPSPTFADYGNATTDENGVCYITLDPMFAEVIQEKSEPIVFLTPYGSGELYVDADATSHDVVVVRGAPNMKFAFEVRYLQAKVSTERFPEEEIHALRYDETDYHGQEDLEIEFNSIDYGILGYNYFTEFERSFDAA